jgi:ABC-type transporter lipoprotein component MlaA
MKVIDWVSYTKEQNEVINYVKKVIPKNYMCGEECTDYYFIRRKYYLGERDALINFKSQQPSKGLKIDVYTPELYDVLYKVGEKFGFEEIRKKWIE